MCSAKNHQSNPENSWVQGWRGRAECCLQESLVCLPTQELQWDALEERCMIHALLVFMTRHGEVVVIWEVVSGLSELL